MNTVNPCSSVSIRGFPLFRMSGVPLRAAKLEM